MTPANNADPTRQYHTTASPSCQLLMHTGPFSSRLPLAIYRQERGDRRENQANLSVLRVLCGEIQLSDGKLNDPWRVACAVDFLSDLCYTVNPQRVLSRAPSVPDLGRPPAAEVTAFDRACAGSTDPSPNRSGLGRPPPAEASLPNSPCHFNMIECRPSLVSMIWVHYAWLGWFCPSAQTPITQS